MLEQGVDPYKDEVTTSMLETITSEHQSNDLEHVPHSIGDANSKHSLTSNSNGKVRFSSDPQLLDEISRFLDAYSHYKLKIRNLHIYLLQRLPRRQVPSQQTLLQIIKGTFHLRYGARPAAMPKYGDPMYNEKRLWVSRLLAQFLVENVVIVSIDECNFKSSNLTRQSWAFNSSLAFKRIKMQQRLDSFQMLKRQCVNRE